METNNNVLKPFELKVRDASKDEFRKLWKVTEKAYVDALWRYLSTGGMSHTWFLKLFRKSLVLESVRVYGCIQAKCKCREIHRKIEEKMVPALTAKTPVREKESIEIEGKGCVDVRTLGVWDNPYFPSCEEECDASWFNPGMKIPHTCVEVWCPTCDGKGHVMTTVSRARDKECPNCFGSGKEATGLTCRRCRGTGHYGEERWTDLEKRECYDCKGEERVRKYMVGHQKIEKISRCEQLMLGPYGSESRKSPVNGWTCLYEAQCKDGVINGSFAKTGCEEVDVWLQKTLDEWKKPFKESEEFKDWQNKYVVDSLAIYAHEDCMVEFNVSLFNVKSYIAVNRYNPNPADWRDWRWDREVRSKYDKVIETQIKQHSGKSRRCASLLYWMILAVVGISVAVHQGVIQNQMLTNLMSIILEYGMLAEKWVVQKMPGLYSFWNWPAVLSLFVISTGSLVIVGSKNLIGALTGMTAIAAGCVLVVALPFMDGISWYLALIVDAVALGIFSLSGLFFANNFENKDVPPYIGCLAEPFVLVAIAYVVCHFFL